MMRIVVVTFDLEPPSHLKVWDREIVVSPAVTPVDGEQWSERMAVKEAMVDAVRASEPYDVVMQDDVTFHSDPFSAPVSADRVTMLTGAWRAGHWCPRAFRYGTETMKTRIVDAWTSSPYQACRAWIGIPKRGVEIGAHDGSRV